MAEVTDMQAKALQLIQNDPEAMRILQQQVHRLDPDGKVVPKQALGDVIMDEKIEAALKPLREQNEALRKQVEDKKERDFHESQRDFMRREYKLSDKAIDELADWMQKDADGNLFKSYEAAHRYRQALSQPTLPTGNVPPQKVSPLTRRPIGSEPWRESFKDKQHALRLSKSDARKWAQEEWTKADQDWMGARK
jgi:hypothetical protein